MPVTITTTSSVVPSDYMNDKANAIYPVFVDNLKYASWISEHVMDNGPDHPEKDYFQMKATGATTYAWSLVSGTLPTGLILSTNGRITGTPTEEGLFEFRVRVVTDVGTEEKDLAITAFPERSRWLRDARLGVTVHWGRFTDPQIKNSPPRGDGTGTTEFQGRVGQFNAASWAQQMESWGAGFIEFSGLWQDSYRNWDSTTVTRYFLHSTRGFMDEIVTAFHARSLKVLCYFPPDYRGNPACQNCSDPDKFLWTDGDGNGNWGGPNIGYVRELVVDKKLDGLWIDIGGASDIFDPPKIIPQWFYWNNILPIIRYNNPFFIFGVNPGTRESLLERKMGGTQVRYPYADFVIYETTKSDSTSASLLETATPLLSKKKMAIYISNQITTSFAWGPGSGSSPVKNTQGTIDNITNNWLAGATVAIALPVKACGELLDSHYQPLITSIAQYVTTNKAFSADLEISYVDGKVVMSTPVPARIFYTLDGSDPDTTSHIYSGPIALKANAKVRARSKEEGKFIGYVKELYVETYANPDFGRKLFSNQVDGVADSEDPGKPYYRGMQFTVGSAPIIVTAVGRRSASAITTSHDIVIKRYFDEYPLYSGSMDVAAPLVDGYQYHNTAEIRLEAGTTYIVCIQENNVDSYLSNAVTEGSIPYSQDLRITHPFFLSTNGDFFPIPPNKIGQLINLKYRVVESERSVNFALGKPVGFFSNAGASLNASALYYAINATDGNMDSWARAGGLIAYTLRVDLLTAVRIDRISLAFTEEAFATEFVIETSLDNLARTTVAVRKNNNLKYLSISFNPVVARYVYIKALQPSLDDQPGAQMAIADLGVFCDNPSFN
ncbi:chitobiase/beta-hexosaminidase C-terminal domain-containing protein [Dyadobacter endophyticus]|uniref:chitobiase/beta-hexosaminidase C-terminal domain-containing protein n=1 Tax=Dyadobacter endophyticus TaxID=1749036 RepID=UPI003CF1EB22